MATTAGAKKGLWSTIRRIAASDRISGLIMLGFALTGLVLANLPATAHAFETVAETHLFIPYTNLDLPIGHWAQDGLLTIFFLTVGLELKQELTTGSLANPKAAAVPMLCAVGGMIAPPILFLAVTALFSQIGPGEPGTLILTTTGSSISADCMARIYPRIYRIIDLFIAAYLSSSRISRMSLKPVWVVTIITVSPTLMQS